ncbi:MAG TPA: hypothetical protein VFC42_09275 [Methylomirabilota bacterium]|nr:hypothetical protein [Methylomirabilota bacterium]
MDESTIRSRIRAMIRTGQLPCDEPEATWAGRGNGKLCAACREPIAREEVEFEVELAPARVIRLHRACHVLWQEECAR